MIEKAPEHHKTLAPSSFNALQHCSHYRPSGRETPESLRGTRIHEHTAEMLRQGPEKMKTFWLKDPEELQACQWLYEQTKNELTEIHGIEQKVEIWDSLSGELITFGRCDCHGQHKMGLPGLVDWKSGKGVEGDHYPQAAIYALALMDKLGVKEVIVSLLYCDQRRVERYTITLEDAETILIKTMAAQADPKSPYVTGVYCRGCVIRESCPAWVEPATQALVTLGASELQGQIEAGLEHVKSDPIALGKFIHGWRKLEKLVEHSDLTAKAIEYIEAGEPLEGWRIDTRRGRSHFTKEAVKMLLESDLDNEELAKVLKIDSDALEKIAPQLFLPKFQLPDYKCLVSNGNGSAK